MLEIRNLTKSFGTLQAVADFSLTIEPGNIMGFVGPNGAGKTTTMRLVATLLQADHGTIRIDGYDIVEHPYQARARLGFMPDFIGVYNDLKVWEYLDFFAAAYRLPYRERKRIVDEVLALTDLAGKRDAYVSSLSKGMKQRLCLAKTLSHDPKLLLLDEPAAGLDPRARIELRELLKELQRMGKTLLVSSHILSELTDLCNQVAIIEKGALLVSGSIRDILAELIPHPRLVIEVVGEEEKAVNLLAAMPSVKVCGRDGTTLTIEYVADDDACHTVLARLVGAGIGVRQFRQETGGVESLFMQVTKGEVT